FPGKIAETYGFNGNQLGPTIRLHRDEQVSIRIDNRLSATASSPEQITNVHWHGLRIPAAADGPHNDIAPGGSFVSNFRVIQPSATMWYHPHTVNSGPQVFRGLAGLLYVDDATSDSIPIPKAYGVDDFPLLVQDKHFS